MVISDEKIIEFQEICKEHFGKEISKEDAYENGVKLLRLISLLYKPINQSEQSQHTKLLEK